MLACVGAAGPAIAREGATASTTVSVLTYNIEGLGWPARHGRAPQLRAIGAQLAAMRKAGTAPDIVLFQEVFSPAAKRAVEATGYPAMVPGPTRTMRPPPAKQERLPGKRNLRRGEFGIRTVGSGLVVASRFPILGVERQPYGRRSCAGLDCLANKGILLARIAVPGVPAPLFVYDTHMNSRDASRVPAERNLAAHERQALEASRFINRTYDDRSPLIFGGDFNMRHSEERWENFSRYQALDLVHRVCADRASGCEVRMSWDGDAPWMDTQDLQFFSGAGAVRIRPIRVEAMFDGSAGEPALSDHDGFLVTYRLSWPAAMAYAGCAPAR